MPDIRDLINYFIDMNNLLNKKVDICILGGSVFVLYQLRPSSPDLDILVEGSDYYQVVKAAKSLEKKYKFNVDILSNGNLENIQMPKNYMKRAKRYNKYKREFPNIRLWTLYVYDIIISKIHRWNKKDIVDINFWINHNRIFRHRLEKRINNYHIPNRLRFEKNLDEFYKLFGSKLKEKWHLF